MVLSVLLQLLQSSQDKKIKKISQFISVGKKVLENTAKKHHILLILSQVGKTQFRRPDENSSQILVIPRNSQTLQRSWGEGRIVRKAERLKSINLNSNKVQNRSLLEHCFCNIQSRLYQQFLEKQGFMTRQD